MARLAALLLLLGAVPQADDSAELLKKIGLRRGIVAVIQPARDGLPVELAAASELVVYAQLGDASRVTALRASAEKAGLLGSRLFAEEGKASRIHLADNLA